MQESGDLTYPLDITSRIRGILETISSEEAISGTRQNAARTVIDICRYTSRLSTPSPLPLPAKQKIETSQSNKL